MSQHFQRPFYLLACLIGLLIGGGSFVAFHKLAQPDECAEDRMRDNSLLVAQQLDQLFAKLEEGLGNPSARSPELMEALRIFYLYDRRFVEQNQDSDVAEMETAYAAQRMAQCANFFGDLEQSRSHYRMAKDKFAALVERNPTVVSSFHDLIDAQVNLAGVEQESGDFVASKREFDEVVRRVKEAPFSPSIDYDGWMAPQYQHLALLGASLGEYDQAMEFAQRFEQSARRLAKAKPSEATEHLASEAEQCLQAITNYVKKAQ
ncbi:MAG: hypothetical protein MI861_04890 [Pirellulales bacterium]|nr:hypothetical protein [Pirellulales bacterium]